MVNRRALSRRRFLKYSALGTAGIASVAGLTVLLDKISNQVEPNNPKSIANNKPISARNAIIAENLQPGNPGWLITNTGNDKQRQIKGYASATSINKGESLELHVSVNPPQNYTMEVYRIGWYNGTGGRLMQTIGPLNGSTYDVPAPDKYGMVACDWPVTYTLKLPTDWTSGVYLIKLINSQGLQNYIHFVLRDDEGTADLLFQCSVTTYHAYDAFGGKSLYPDNSSEGIPARKVSLDRPYSNTGMGQFFNWEMPTVRFLEKYGYSLAYCTDLDLHTNAELMDKHKAFLSVGHDEYWSRAMYDHALAFRDQGKHLAFLGANAIYWQIRLESSAKGAADRVITCYKNNFAEDPQYPGPNTTYLWRSISPNNAQPELNRPENQLIGMMFNAWENDNVGVPFVVKNSDHWAYAGSGFTEGSSIPGIVGYEWDKRFENGLEPAGVVELGSSPVTLPDGNKSVSNATIYQASSGAWVFATGTIYWAYALDFCGFQTTDLRNSGIQQMTRNIMDRFITTKTSSLPQARPTTGK